MPHSKGHDRPSLSTLPGPVMKKPVPVMGASQSRHPRSEAAVQVAVYLPTPHVTFEHARHSLARPFRGTKRVLSTHSKGQSSPRPPPPVKLAFAMGVQFIVQPPRPSSPPHTALYLPASVHTPVGQGAQAREAKPSRHA